MPGESLIGVVLPGAGLPGMAGPDHLLRPLRSLSLREAMLGPGQLDGERHPRVRLETGMVRRSGTASFPVLVEGELTLAGVSRPVTLRARVDGQAVASTAPPGPGTWGVGEPGCHLPASPPARTGRPPAPGNGPSCPEPSPYLTPEQTSLLEYLRRRPVRIQVN